MTLSQWIAVNFKERFPPNAELLQCYKRNSILELLNKNASFVFWSVHIHCNASSGWQYALVSLPTCNSLTPPDYGGAHQGATSEA